MSLEKTYQPQSIESKWYDAWQKNDYFSPRQGDADKAPFCIMIPPPNVTGSLHMGHAFQDTIMDALTRFHRMRGHETLWQPGTDHAGIATQMVVERLINAEGKTRHDYGREGFLKRVWEWKEESGGNIKSQLKRLGASADWEHERFTMDEGLSDAVKEVFVRLYDEGLIYRGKRLVNWDPKLHTALSDLEVLSEEENGQLWHLRYPLADGSGYLVVATTRPETMLGDAAVAVHPDDERYQHLVGQKVALPLTNREIPIIADEYVDPEFGSGCVKITPAHDFNDYAVWQRHQHADYMASQPHGGLINIMTIDAAIRDNQNDEDVTEGELIPSKYIGMSREEARASVLDDFKALDLLEKIDPHTLKIPRGDRSGVVVEPFLTNQWYVDLTREKLDDGRPGGKAQITDPAIDVVRSGRIEFVPENWSKTYFQWLENIEDWCISRQLWWGHRIPAWYDEDGNVYVGRDEDEVRTKYALQADLALTQDEDVLDTWFSSALWPFSTLGWPENTERLNTFYPTSVLVTGFDIIFFWVARMIMFGQKFIQEVPFKQVYITGLVRDAHGQKMSKSKGNVLDPIDLIDGIDLDSLVEKKTKGMMQTHLVDKVVEQTRKDFPEGIAPFGTDALRFTFAALATNGRDINFDLGRTEGYRNFCNKIWNAARYVLMNTENADCGVSGQVELSLADRWILSQLQKTTEQVIDGIISYRFDFAARALYEFIWHQYCDWYLELCKPVLNSDDASEAQKAGTRQTLVRVLESAMRLVHPIMPFISEEIWQKVAPLAGVKGDSIMLQAFPESDLSLIDEKAEQEIEWLMQFILAVRQIKGEMNIAPSKPVDVLLVSEQAEDLQRAQALMPYLQFLAKVESLSELGDEDTSKCAMAQFAKAKLYIPLEGLVDIAAEIERISSVVSKMEKEVARLSGKLSNEKFVANAPEQVVANEREKLADAEHKLAEAKDQLAALK